MTTTIFIVAYKEKKIDGRSKFAKYLKEHAVFFQSNKLKENELAGWIQDFIQAMGELKQGNVESSTKKGRYMKGRLIYRAWAEDQGKANAAVFKAIDNANEVFSRKQYFRKVSQ